MKNIWQESDIVAGRYIIKESSPKGSCDLSFARSVAFKIGFINSGDKKYGLTNCLTDGWFCPMAETKAEVAKMLNEDSYGYRPLTKEEYISMVHSTEQGFY